MGQTVSSAAQESDMNFPQDYSGMARTEVSSFKYFFTGIVFAKASTTLVFVKTITANFAFAHTHRGLPEHVTQGLANWWRFCMDQKQISACDKTGWQEPSAI